MKILMVNGIECVIQAYDPDEYVNLSPMQDTKTPYYKKLGNIRITFYNDKILTEGKETTYWKEFVKGIDIECVKKELKGSLSRKTISHE